MTHKALIRKLQISCLGLDPVDPLRLLVDDVIEALRENAMREVQRLGQEIEQEPVAYWKEHAQGLQRDYDSLLADFQAQSGQKLIGTVGELFDDKVIAHRKLDRDLLVYIKENT